MVVVDEIQYAGEGIPVISGIESDPLLESAYNLGVQAGQIRVSNAQLCQRGIRWIDYLTITLRTLTSL